MTKHAKGDPFLIFVLAALKQGIKPRSWTGWWYTYPKNMSSSVGMFIPNIWKNKQCSKPPASWIMSISNTRMFTYKRLERSAMRTPVSEKPISPSPWTPPRIFSHWNTAGCSQSIGLGSKDHAVIKEVIERASRFPGSASCVSAAPCSWRCIGIVHLVTPKQSSQKTKHVFPCFSRAMQLWPLTRHKSVSHPFNGM